METGWTLTEINSLPITQLNDIHKMIQWHQEERRVIEAARNGQKYENQVERFERIASMSHMDEESIERRSKAWIAQMNALRTKK